MNTSIAVLFGAMVLPMTATCCAKRSTHSRIALCHNELNRVVAVHSTFIMLYNNSMAKKKSNVKPEERAGVLKARRQTKMSTSAHAYVRGNTEHFYRWLSTKAGRTVPQGPPVWICGDCHVGNIGPLADSYGNVEIQIRDLDQTVIGNPSHDLIRLALSLATAARGSDLPGLTVVAMLEQMIEGYKAALRKPAKSSTVKDIDALAPIRSVLDQSHRREWQHLAKERIKDVRPRIPLGERFWELKEEERTAITELFQDEVLIEKVTAFKGKDHDAKVEVLDAAYWMKGCSSLGRLRYAVLLGIGGKKQVEYCLIDLKEATVAAAPQLSVYDIKDQAERVVKGARNLSPNLGSRMMPVSLMNRSMVMRELMPQDLKFDLDRLTRDEAVAAARYLAGVLGKAHGRQMNRKIAASWMTELKKQHTSSLDAPGWLWSSVVSLIAEHEVAYLEHCRRFTKDGGAS